MSDLTEPEAFEAERDALPDVLLKAVDVIETRGWHQGGYYDPEARFDRHLPIEQCGVCLRGALNVAAGFEPSGPDNRSDARQDAVDALAFHLGYEEAEDGDEGTAWFLTTWHDDFHRRKAEVLTALRECAASLKAGA